MATGRLYTTKLYLGSLIFVYSILFLKGAFLEKVKWENPGVPLFLFGHSTGGAVVLKV